jgi:hypothetical protein
MVGDFVYDDFIPRFRAERFDPDAWIRLFEQAGAKYFVLTSKHHDGFGLWPTNTTHRDAMEMGPQRDLVGELFAAARRARDRVKPGLYYSIPEWFNPASQPPKAMSGCRGTVRVTVLLRTRKVAAKRTHLGPTCRYRARVRIPRNTRARLRVRVRSPATRFFARPARPRETSRPDDGGFESGSRHSDWDAGLRVGAGRNCGSPDKPSFRHALA